MTLPFKNKSIFYEVTGDGKPLVLLHGFLESSNIWKHFIPSFNKNFKVITIDLPGHGKSEVLAKTHTMEMMAESVLAVLDTLKIESAHFMGHSMGGYVTLALAELFESRVASIILLNSSPVEDSHERKMNRERALKFIPKYTEAFVSMGISNLFTDASRNKYASEIETLKQEALTFPDGGIAAAIRGMKDRKDRTDVLQRFPRQKILIAGKNDPIMPFEESQHIANETNAKLIAQEGGHMGWIENTSEIIEIVSIIEKK